MIHQILHPQRPFQRSLSSKNPSSPNLPSKSPCFSLLLHLQTSMSPLLLLLLCLSFTPSLSLRGTYIDCGASRSTTYNGQEWLPDDGFVSAGVGVKVPTPGLLPVLQTVRAFPGAGNLNRRFCYEVPAYRGVNYLVRTTYFYGGFNGKDRDPPVFDQIVDGTLWSVVNTTSDYKQQLTTYYEGVFRAVGKTLDVCVGVNTYTDSDPFISALEVITLDNSLYNSTDFDEFALGLVSRHAFGYNGSILRYPDDQYDRYWQPYGDYNPVSGTPNMSVSGFWNVPPLKVFETRLTADYSGSLQIQWPPGPLPSTTYYLALYFADDRVSSPDASRAFSISINDVPYYNKLEVTPSGVSVFASKWPLSGLTNIKLSPAEGSDMGPLINAAEAFFVLPRGNRTLIRDAIAMESIKSSLDNPPQDWGGDPCYPVGYSWSGITCSRENRTRIVSINLSNRGLTGTLSSYIGNLTAISSIKLGNNFISGPIPDLSKLKNLETLSLENNQLNGTIPSSLGELSSLRELHLENNQLTGTVPRSLIGKPGLKFTYSPGNNLSAPAPSSS